MIEKENTQLKEYKKPILTKKGKAFLKQLIVPFELSKVTYVEKVADINMLRIDFGLDCWVSYTRDLLGEKWYLFKNLDFNKLYTLEDLGLC